MPPKRECLPSAERDNYIAARRLLTSNEIAIRLSQRYIDEFLRFCEAEFGHTEADKITERQLIRFVADQSTKGILKNTVRLKASEVLKWLAWLKENGVLKRNPVANLKAADLLR